jgi:hypothetical protein
MKNSDPLRSRTASNCLRMIRLLTTLSIDSETSISWLPSSGQRCSLSRATARAIRDSLRRTTATILKLQELLHQSDETLRRLGASASDELAAGIEPPPPDQHT